MAMTKAELAKQLEALQAQYDDMEDDDDELWIRLPNGNEVCLKGARLKQYLKKNGLEEEEVEDVSDESEVEVVKPARKTAAKKTTSPRKNTKPATKTVEEELDEIDDILEDEAEEVSPRRFF